MPIEANVPKQQEEGSANVSSTLFSNCMRGAAGPPHLRGGRFRRGSEAIYGRSCGHEIGLSLEAGHPLQNII